MCGSVCESDKRCTPRKALVAQRRESGAGSRKGEQTRPRSLLAPITSLLSPPHGTCRARLHMWRVGGAWHVQGNLKGGFVTTEGRTSAWSLHREEKEGGAGARGAPSSTGASVRAVGCARGGGARSRPGERERERAERAGMGSPPPHPTPHPPTPHPDPPLGSRRAGGVGWGWGGACAPPLSLPLGRSLHWRERTSRCLAVLPTHTHTRTRTRTHRPYTMAHTSGRRDYAGP